MRFVEIINKKKISLISVFLFLYVILNLLDGERGLISYYEKQRIINNLNSKASFWVLNIKIILYFYLNKFT